MSLAFIYIKYAKISLEKNYPYEAKEGECRSKEEGEKFIIDDLLMIKPIEISGLDAAIE